MNKIEEIKTMYFDQGLNTVAISKKVGVTKQYVSKVLDKNYKEEYSKEKQQRKLCKQSEVENLFFNKKLSASDIAEKLQVSKPYITAILQNSNGYKIEKERRKVENSQNREQQRKLRREMQNENNVSIEEMRRQQEITVRCMSSTKHMSTRGAVYSSLNAYDVKEDYLVFNEKKVGARPADLPRAFSMNINIY